jgi:hypothetical protein
MKKYILLILALTNCVLVLAQNVDNTEKKDSSNIYYDAFKRVYTSFDVKDRILYVEKSNITTESLQVLSIPNKIELVDYLKLRKMTKGNRKVNLIRIVPIKIKNNEFYITIIEYDVTYKRKNWDYVNLGGAKVIYNYNSQKGIFEFKEIR